MKRPGQNPTANPAGFTTALTTHPGPEHTGASTHINRFWSQACEGGQRGERGRRAQGDGLARRMRQGMKRKKPSLGISPPSPPWPCLRHHQAACSRRETVTITHQLEGRRSSGEGIYNKACPLSAKRQRKQSLTSDNSTHRTTGHPARRLRLARVSKGRKKKQ